MNLNLYDLGLIFYFTTCFLFAGLAVSVALRSGLFNVGCEGQLQIAACAAAIAGLVPMAAPLSYVFVIVVAVLVGALWASLAGALKAHCDAHEVLSTIMLNFIALAICQWLTVEHFQDANSQNPQTRMMHESFLWFQHDPLNSFFDGAPVSIFFIIAIIAAVILYFWFRHSKFALKMKAISFNTTASHFSGIVVSRLQILTMALSGALAAGVSLTEVLGSSGQYRLGFSADFGFVGIAVALVARGNPLLCIPSALFFACIQKFSQDMELESTWMTRDLSFVLQGLLILLIVVVSRKRSVRGAH